MPTSTRAAVKTIRLFSVFLLAASLFCQAAPTVEERLKALESQVAQLAAENSSLKRELGWNAGKLPVEPVEAMPAGKEIRLTVGGFLQAQGEFGHAADPRWSGTKDRFFFRRARIYLAGSFAEDFDFKAELDLQGNTLSAGTGQLTRANEVYINWRKFPFANLRFGQLKPAFGAEALAQDTKIPTIERSLASDRFTDSRQLALSLSGELFDKKLSYVAVAANGNGPNVSANDNSKFQKSVRVAYAPVATAADKLAFGLDGLWSSDAGVAKSDFGFTGNLFSGRREMWGADVQWTHGRWDLSAEYLHGNFHPQNAVPFSTLNAAGWHVTAACFLIPARVQAVFSHQEFDPNAALGGNTFHTDLFGLSYLIKGDDIKFSVNYLDGHTPGSTASGDRLLTRMQIIF